MFEVASFLMKIHNRPSVFALNLKNGSSLLKGTCSENLFILPSRTAIIVKRRFPIGLYKEGNKPRLPPKSYHYIMEENTECNQIQPMDIVLTSHVSGVGNPGDIVTMKRNKAYEKFLLPGLADYPTLENLEYSKNIKANETIQKEQIPPMVDLTMRYLKRRCFSVVMNKETEWTVEPWHVKASFRKAGVHMLSDSSIELPKQPIRGPDLELEGKEFNVTVTINKHYKVETRCTIHHWSTNPEDRLPYVENHWLNPSGKIFPEEKSKQTTEESNIS